MGYRPNALAIVFSLLTIDTKVVSDFVKRYVTCPWKPPLRKYGAYHLRELMGCCAGNSQLWFLGFACRFQGRKFIPTNEQRLLLLD